MSLRTIGIVAIVVAASSALRQDAHATYTYWIDGNTNYGTDHGCGTNSNLADDTASLGGELSGSGWTGARYTDISAWPADFTEACNSSVYGPGIDSSAADTQQFGVISGHANAGYMAFAYPDSGMCGVDVGTNARLGQMAGGTMSQMVYYGCCTMKLDSLATDANYQWVYQSLGFLDTESNGDDDIKDYFNGSYSNTNKNSWFSHLEDRPGWWTGDNSPIIVSYGVNNTETISVETYAKLKAGVYTDTVRSGGPSCGNGPPSFYYRTSYIDHGNGGC
jgi:hypothetical protein